MQVKVERFLALTAVLASTALIGAGCASEDTAAAPDAGTSGTGGGGTGGTAGGSTGGSAGSTGGAAGGGGAAGSGGAAASGGAAGAGGDAATECLGDTPSTDAGIAGICSTLPYATSFCPDAGTESGVPLGVELCAHMDLYGRPGVTEAVAGCLAQISGDPCAQAHDDAANGCITSVFPQACDNGGVNLGGDAGTVTCAQMAQACKDEAGDAAASSVLTEQQCQAAMNAHTEAAKVNIYNCWQSGTGDCTADFEYCTFYF